jgi:hypothetical protein
MKLYLYFCPQKLISVQPKKLIAMATVNERLAESLRILKDYQEKNNFSVIRGRDILGRTHTKRLLDNGYLQTIIKGWYMSSLPGNEGDTTIWYTSLWKHLKKQA